MLSTPFSCLARPLGGARPRRANHAAAGDPREGRKRGTGPSEAREDKERPFAREAARDSLDLGGADPKRET
jgi:hypothetical protein